MSRPAPAAPPPPPPRWPALLRRLTEPAAAITDQGERRSVRLLATMLLVLIPIGLVSALVQLRSAPRFAHPFAIIVSALLLLAIAYVAIRTVHYRWGGVVASVVPIVSGGAVGLVSPHDPAWFAFMATGTLLASAFLPTRAVAAVGAASIVTTAAVLVANGIPLLSGRGTSVMTIGTVLPGLIVLVGWHRRQVERDREAAIRESEARYRVLFENAPVGMGVATTDGRLLDFNDAMLRPGGYSRPDIERSPIVADLYYDAEVRPLILGRLRSEGRVLGEEVRFRRKDGTPYDVSLSLVPIMIGGRRCTLAISEDITERKRAVDTVRTNEQRLRVAIDIADLAVFEMDEDLRYTWMYSPQLGYSPEQVIGKTDRDLLGRDGARVMDIKRRVLTTGESAREEVHVQLGPHDRTFLLTVEPRRSESGEIVGLTGASLDVTEARELQIRMLHAQKMESVGRLAGGVAHDFNNVLTAIQSYLDLALIRIGGDHPARKELGEVKKAAQSAAGLTRQLLAFSRRQVVEPRVLSLNDVIRRVEQMLRRLIGEDIVLETRLHEDLGCVRCDPGQCEQILVNLAINSRDAMRNGGTIVLETENESLPAGVVADGRRVDPGEYVVLRFRDSGCGMDERLMANIFEPFFTTKEPGVGTGLGLSMVHDAVKRGGGWIDVESEVGRGTTFTIHFPRVAGGGAPESRASNGAADTGTETIVLVEDDDSIRSATGAILELHGYRIHSFRNGDEALRAIAAMDIPLHLLLTDVIMPGMNGRELASRVRALRPGLPVLYMSGYDDGAIAGRDDRDPSVAFLPKPYSMESLARRVREVLDSVA